MRSRTALALLLALPAAAGAQLPANWNATTALGSITGNAPCSLLPALTGDTTSSAGACATVTSKLNGNTPGGTCTAQFVRSVSASAVPTCASIAGADLPNPSSSTLGGVQSYAAVSNQWISSISTSGVPASTQPGFSNLSGSLACSQHPALTGDVTNSAGSCATTVAADAVALTTDTTGNYVGTVSAGSGISVSGADAEGATKTVAVANAGITNAMLGSASYSKTVFVATCSGTATSSATLYLFPIGQVSAFTCTVTTPTSGIPMPTAGTLKNLTFKSGTGGKAGDAVTILKNTSATGMPTCVYGTGTTCSDTTTAGAVVAGDLITVKIATTTSDTTANVQVTFELWN